MTEESSYKRALEGVGLTEGRPDPKNYVEIPELKINGLQYIPSFWMIITKVFYPSHKSTKFNDNKVSSVIKPEEIFTLPTLRQFMHAYYSNSDLRANLSRIFRETDKRIDGVFLKDLVTSGSEKMEFQTWHKDFTPVRLYYARSKLVDEIGKPLEIEGQYRIGTMPLPGYAIRQGAHLIHPYNGMFLNTTSKRGDAIEDRVKFLRETKPEMNQKAAEEEAERDLIYLFTRYSTDQHSESISYVSFLKPGLSGLAQFKSNILYIGSYDPSTSEHNCGILPVLAGVSKSENTTGPPIIPRI